MTAQQEIAADILPRHADKAARRAAHTHVGLHMFGVFQMGYANTEIGRPQHATYTGIAANSFAQATDIAAVRSREARKTTTAFFAAHSVCQSKGYELTPCYPHEFLTVA